MLSRALILAAVTVIFGFLAAGPAGAQNLEAGKPPSAIFSSTCSLCHKSSRGLLKTVSPGSLPGFLRQHYTTSTDMAASMSAYVLSNGAANAAPGGNLTKQGQESRSAPKPDAEQAAKDGAKDGARSRRPTREASKPDAAKPDVDGLSDIPNVPESAAEAARPDEPKPDKSKHGARQKAAKDSAKGKPKGEPKTEPKVEPKEPPKAEAAREPAKDESKPETRPETRPDPVPAVTPAGEDTAAAVPAGPKTVDDLPTGPLTIEIDKPKPPAAVAATPAVAPAGPPSVPISQ